MELLTFIQEIFSLAMNLFFFAADYGISILALLLICLKEKTRHPERRENDD